MRRNLAALVGAVAALGAALTASGALASGSSSPQGASFRAGAAVQSFTPPAAGGLQSDPADCVGPADSQFTGPRYFAFEEPYIDQQGDGHYDPGDPFIDCNQNGRWDGDTLGGGAGAPRYYDHVADQVGARALVISNRHETIAMEVVDNEGLFNTYADRIRAKVLADGYRIDNIQISSTHDESAPDTIGLGGQDSVISGTNGYFANYLVAKSALAIERGVQQHGPRPSPLCRGGRAIEPAPVLVLLSVHRQPADACPPGRVEQRADDRHPGQREPARRDPGVQRWVAARPRDQVHARPGEAVGVGRLAVLVPLGARVDLRRRRHRDGRSGGQRRDS